MKQLFVVELAFQTLVYSSNDIVQTNKSSQAHPSTNNCVFNIKKYWNKMGDVNRGFQAQPSVALNLVKQQSCIEKFSTIVTNVGEKAKKMCLAGKQAGRQRREAGKREAIF
ncbi:hypothetical protein T01_189 [Trichinella spiralis]|uniref:Uncharacterized protein n=1 Tax=Trichinella spiralis TaxID=6334 RepID=A0A0V1B0V1_TRISP|nr:hypothetical protein T01_189 [Trichinella spiralis]